METPNSSTNSKGVKVDSYDWESNFDSCSSSEDSQSNTFVSEDEDNDVDGEKEGEGSVSSVDDSFRLLTDMEIMEMKFVSEDDAGQFYNAYAKAIGFSVRKYKSRPQKGNEMYVRWRTWVCSGEGKRNKKHLERTDRKRRHKAETRTGCGAKLRACRMSKTMKNYVVTEFVCTHNHPLAAPHCVPFLRSHRRVGDTDIAQSGGFHNLGFTVKDLHNKLHSIRKEEIRNGDAEGALGYLSAQVSNDPLFFFKYTVDEDDRLETLFWTDGRSKMDYAAFGDVLIFDTTYRTNAYKKPFVILAGVSNNFTTTIFACALMSKEMEDTYNWFLSTFLEAMDGKWPISVVTNGDLAMRNAIRNIFSDVRHRLCSWHLERNAVKNVHIPEFISDFTILMQMECDVEEFETLWADMVSHYGHLKLFGLIWYHTTA
ncbi:protein FAR1-RELATED SEQUENCE 5-like [Rhododendron vialii]|uniref:protein FAR1-RELATED SEQUENCE 5-like n=1 Tax=Rhododendron vialii TaxID=182163 RepID=UPI00265EAC81|nr:protein FAR1-RELATED SEQUENCE 5-like [Rhododendron vialii]